MSDATEADVRAKTENVICACLDVGLRLIAPFMPFVSEELWQRIPKMPSAAAAPSITVAPFPSAATWSEKRDEALEARVAPVIAVIGHCRSVKSTYGIADNVKPQVFFNVPAGDLRATVDDFKEQIDALARVKCALITGEPPAGCAQEACEGVDIFLMVKGHVDIEKQVSKLEKEIAFLDDKVAKEKAFLASEHAKKMPADKLESRQKKLEDYIADLAAKTATLARYQSL